MSARKEALELFAALVAKLDIPSETSSALIDAAHAWVAAACNETIDDTIAAFKRNLARGGS